MVSSILYEVCHIIITMIRYNLLMTGSWWYKRYTNYYRLLGMGLKRRKIMLI